MNASKKVGAMDELLNERHQLKIALASYQSAWRDIDFWDDYNADMIILDESQNVKNRGAKQSKAVHLLGHKTPYKIIMTGTTITESPLDVWSQYKFLNPKVFGSLSTFKEKYVKEVDSYGNPVEYQNLEDLAEKLHSIAYRITKAEALDLPPTTNVVYPVPFTRDKYPEAYQYYTEMLNDLVIGVAEGRFIEAPIILTQLMYLQEILGGFLNTEDEQLRFPSPKMDALKDIMNGLPNQKKVVIFCRFLAEIDSIMEALKDRHPLELSGRIKSKAARTNLIQTFQTNPRVGVLVCQIKTGGVGITLTAADTAIYYSLTFSNDAYEQSKGRIHRIGQHSPCTYIHLIPAGTIEEDIYRNLKTKGDTARLIQDTLRKGIKGMPKTKAAELSIEDKLQALKNLLENEDEGEDTPVVAPEPETPKKVKQPKVHPKATVVDKDVISIDFGPQKEVGDSKGKVQKAPSGKPEKAPAPPPKAPKIEGGEVVTAKDLAYEFGISPMSLRKKMRVLVGKGEVEHQNSGRWEWSEDSKELARIRKLIKGE